VSQTPHPDSSIAYTTLPCAKALAYDIEPNLSEWEFFAIYASHVTGVE
jgi:hypothetical protein